MYDEVQKKLTSLMIKGPKLSEKDKGFNGGVMKVKSEISSSLRVIFYRDGLAEKISHILTLEVPTEALKRMKSDFIEGYRKGLEEGKKVFEQYYGELL